MEEDLPFHSKAFEGAWGEPATIGNFDGDGLVNLAAHAFGPEDGAHAATAEERAKLVGTEAFVVRNQGALVGDRLLEEGLRAGVVA